MATTISNFTGQFPQTSQFDSNTPDIKALYHLESDATATVGDSLTSFAKNTEGVSNFDNYGLFGKCWYVQSRFNNSEFGGTVYYKSGAVSSWDWSSSGTTYSIWHKHGATNPTPARVLFGYDQSAGSVVFYVGINSTTKQYTWNIWNSTLSISIQFSSDTTLVDPTDGKWHNIMCVSESASSHSFYIDGVLHDFSSTNIGSVSPAYNATLGGFDGGGQLYGLWGYLDEFAIIDRGLTSTEAYAYGGSL